MIGEYKAMWCGVEIMKDPDTNLTWSYWNNRWFVLSGPDPRTNEWDRSLHYWNPMPSSPRYYTFAAQREREDGGFDDAQPQEGASALADGTPLAEGEEAQEEGCREKEINELSWPEKQINREFAIAQNKNSPEYKLLCQLPSASGATLRGPDPGDPSISKRSWERLMHKWRMDIKLEVGIMYAI